MGKKKVGKKKASTKKKVAPALGKDQQRALGNLLARWVKVRPDMKNLELGQDLEAQALQGSLSAVLQVGFGLCGSFELEGGEEFLVAWVSPEQIATSCQASGLEWRELPSGKPIARFAKNGGRALTYSPSSKMLLHADGDHLGMWSPSGEFFGEGRLGSLILDIAWLEGEEALVAAGDGIARVALQEEMGIDWLDRRRIYSCAALGPGGLAAGGRKEIAEVWYEGSEDSIWLDDHNGRVSAIALSDDGTKVATGDAAGAVRVWELPRGEVVRELQSHDAVSGLAFAKAGEGLLATDSAGWLTYWGRHTSFSILAHEGGISSLSVSPDGAWAASGGRDGRVCVWVLPGAACLAPQGSPRTYRPSGTFKEGEEIQHPTFGIGRIVGVTKSSVVVRFESEDKKLAHGRPH